MSKYAQIGNVRKWSKINFREKFHLNTPYIFVSFGEIASYYKNISLQQKMTELWPKKTFLAITFESLDQTFTKSGI